MQHFRLVLVSCKQCSLLMCFMFLLLAAGNCTGYKAGNIDSYQVDAYRYRSVVEGISIAADPYDSAERAREVFSADLNTKGFYPINVIIHNTGNDRIIFLKERAELIAPGGDSYKPVDIDTMYRSFEHNKFIYLPLDFGIFSYFIVREVNKKMESSWREKELPNQLTVLPGERANGCLYFRLREGKTMSGCTLSVYVEKSGSEGLLNFRILFYDRDKLFSGE